MRAVSGWIVGNYMQCTPGSSGRTHGTAVPREREAQTEQHMLGHRFPAWNKSTGLPFIPNVCDLHERTAVTQPQQCRIPQFDWRDFIFHMSPTPSLSNLMMIAVLKRVATKAGAKWNFLCLYRRAVFDQSLFLKTSFIDWKWQIRTILHV